MPQIAVNPDTMTNVMEGNDWQSEFELDLLGVPKASVRNTSLVIRHDRRWCGVLSHCQVSNRIIKVNLPPMPNSEKGEWTYEDVAALRIWLSHQYGFSPSHIDINDALIVAVKYTQLHSGKNMKIKNTITVDIDEQELRLLILNEAKRRVQEELEFYPEGVDVEQTDSGYRVSLHYEAES